MPAATPADVKATLSAFAAVDDAVIRTWLDRAARIVDDSWAEADRSHAQILLAAHYMTQVGLGSGAEAELGAAGALGFKSMRSGSLSLDRGDTKFADRMGGYGETQYGRMFWPLLRANRSGARVTSSGHAPVGCGLDPRIPRWPRC